MRTPIAQPPLGRPSLFRGAVGKKKRKEQRKAIKTKGKKE
jgi:hypothetical protein